MLFTSTICTRNQNVEDLKVEVDIQKGVIQIRE